MERTEGTMKKVVACGLTAAILMGSVNVYAAENETAEVQAAESEMAETQADGSGTSETQAAESETSETQAAGQKRQRFWRKQLRMKKQRIEWKLLSKGFTRIFSAAMHQRRRCPAGFII